MALYELADLVLLPFRDSSEDLRVVVRDMERFPNAYALPSQWPTNRWQQEAAARLISSMPNDFLPRVLTPTFAVSASKLLLQAVPPESMPIQLNNAARALAHQVLNLLAYPNGH